MKLINFRLCIVAALLILFSCKKNKDQPDQVILLTEEENTNGVTSYHYDSQNRLIKSTYIDNTNSNYNNTITVTKFNSAGLVEETLREDGSTVDIKTLYEYDASGRLIKKEIYQIDGAVETHSQNYLYSYTTGKLNISVQKFDPASTVLTNELSYDGDGNISQIGIFSSLTGDLAVTVTYNSYDDKKSPRSLLPLAFDVNQTRNNRLSSTSTTVSGGAVTNYTYTYEYNADGYPVKNTATGATTTGVIHYTYEKR